MTEFEYKSSKYRIKKLNAIEQWHLNRKVAPLLPPLIPVILRFQKLGNKVGSITANLEDLAELVIPLTNGFANMSNEDSEFIINTALGALMRQLPDGNWTKIWSPVGKISQFEEINELPVTLFLVGKVVWDTLGPFISGLLTAQESEVTEAATE